MNTFELSGTNEVPWEAFDPFKACFYNFFSFFYFPGGSDNKEPVCNVGDPGSIPGLGRSPGEGHGNPLQYSCMENSMDRRA